MGQIINSLIIIHFYELTADLPSSFLHLDEGESCFLSTAPGACSTTSDEYEVEGGAVVICGSPGEVGNDNAERNIFSTAFGKYIPFVVPKYWCNVIVDHSNPWSIHLQQAIQSGTMNSRRTVLGL